MMAGQMDPEKMWAYMQKYPAKTLGITQAELDGWMVIGEEKSKYMTEILPRPPPSYHATSYHPTDDVAGT